MNEVLAHQIEVEIEKLRLTSTSETVSFLNGRLSGFLSALFYADVIGLATWTELCTRHSQALTEALDRIANEPKAEPEF